ncbi:MAG TPA: cupredoxin domain-containing protein [Dehalococcoidia bacterium]|nr:cupredoxin domain-containing protein [Dehalococcoidia bacterium]
MTQQVEAARPPAGNRSWYRKIALFGVALVLMFPIILTIGLIIGEEYEALIFTAVVAVIALAVGAVLLFLGRWWPIVGIIGGLAAAGSSLEFVAFSIEHFDSFFDFTTTIFPLVGGILLIVGSALALWDERKEPVATQAPAAWQTSMLGITGVLAAVSVISLILTLTGFDSVSDEERAAADTVVEMKQTEFEPDVIEVSAGEIAVVVENDDPIVHTFTIDDLDVDEDLGASDEKFIEFSAEPGEYELKCDVPGHESMDAIIRVQ